MIIGAETEYGILGHDRNGYIAESWFLTTEVVRTVVDFFSAFERTLEGIEDEKQHSLIEDLIISRRFSIKDLFGLGSELKRLRQGLSQRHGMTGMVLANGGRLYIDNTHPEYSIPETSNPLDAMIAQKAGDFIVNVCRKLAEDNMKKGAGCTGFFHDPTIQIHIDRTNTDGKGASYAGHENYAILPLTFNRIVKAHRFGGYYDAAFMTFLAARQIIAGAGKVGSERGKPVPYQISARADFIETELNSNTMRCRPIINTRDMPYADKDIVRRLHVICGDSNMSQISLFLKFGITALFLMMLESGFLDSQETSFRVPLSDPVLSFHNISRDIEFRHQVVFANGKKMRALEIMFEFADLAERFVLGAGLPSVWIEVAEKLHQALLGLDGARHENEVSRSLDWVVKERLLEMMIEERNISWSHPECAVINLRYQNIDRETGLFYKLEEDGEIAKMVDESVIELAACQPPKDTRAGLRGYLVSNYQKRISNIGWDYIFFKDGSEVRLPNPHTFEAVSENISSEALGIINLAREACRRRTEDA